MDLSNGRDRNRCGFLEGNVGGLQNDVATLAHANIFGECAVAAAEYFVHGNVVEGRDALTVNNERLFSITPSGVDAITEWVQHSAVEPPVLKHGVALRAWLGHLADPDRLREVVTEHRDNSARLAGEAIVAAERAADTDGWEFPTLVMRWSQRYYEAERDLASAMLADLEQMRRVN